MSTFYLRRVAPAATLLRRTALIVGVALAIFLTSVVTDIPPAEVAQAETWSMGHSHPHGACTAGHSQWDADGAGKRHGYFVTTWYSNGKCDGVIRFQKYNANKKAWATVGTLYRWASLA